MHTPQCRDAAGKTKVPRGASKYRITVKDWDRHYGEGHVVFKHVFEVKKSAEADAQAVELLEKAMRDHGPPKGREAAAWTERFDPRYGPQMLRSYTASNGAWIDTRRGVVAERGHRVADFNTLDDLITHAARDLGATHASGAEANTKLYFPRGGQYPYEEATVWRKNGYWHAQGPSARTGITKLPSDARSIGAQSGRRAAETPRRVVRDYIAVDRRGRTIAGPFKTYGPAKDAAGTAGTVQYVRAGVGEARRRGQRRSDAQKYKPTRGVKLRVVDRVVPSHGAYRVEFQDGLAIQVHNGSGRSDLFYAMKPIDLRHEQRSPGPESRREYQYVALKTVLGDRPADFVVDSDGDVKAYVHDVGGHATEAKRAPRRRAPDPLEQAEAAGAQYASDQINDDYFRDWVRKQLFESSKMDPSEVLPLETKDDAMVIARNMFQDLEWDTKRGLDNSEIASLSGADANREVVSAFYRGFKKTLHESREWLADELLEIKSALGDRTAESKRRRPKAKKAARRKR